MKECGRRWLYAGRHLYVTIWPHQFRRHGEGGMLRWAIGILMAGVALVCCAQGQTKLPAKWEELTAEEFRQAIGKAQGTCLLPFGILEKHGPHLPLGTDLLNVRYVTEH